MKPDRFNPYIMFGSGYVMRISFYDVAVKTDGSNGSTINPTLP